MRARLSRRNRPKLDAMAVCAQCGRQNADDARFCSGCAAPLVPEPATPRAVRKTVTLLFCDMVDSTPLGEQLDPESVRRVLARWHESMRRALERHGGTVEKFVGDAVMAVFGLPVAHEDDALRAARAAADMRVTLSAINADLEREYGVEIQVRTAVHTGDVVAGDGETLVTGDAVNVAARLEENAKAGEILLGEQTASLLGESAIVEPVPVLTLKGKAEPVSAWRLISVLPDVPAFTRPISTPFVGRRDELAELEAAFERAAADSRCEQITVLGPPGIGKSRLLREAVAALGTLARVVVGRCLPYGEGVTYFPLVEIVREIAGRDPRPRLAELLGPDENAELVAETVAAAVGASEGTGSTDETHWAIRMLLEALARDRPLVVVLEDLHWAEPRFLDLVEYVAGFSRERPILLLGSGRPELLETRPTWATAGENAELLRLEPLAEPDVDTLVQALLENRTFPVTARAKVLEAAEGNPLFVEQLLALHAEDGAGVGELVVPPTLRALLAARIDRLEPVDRAVIERAAVEGRRFHRGAVAELLPSGQRPDVGTRLLALARRQLIRPDRSDFAGDDGFRFAHMLIRDAAYESTPKELRADLHERYADWLEAKSTDRIREYEEILGYHLEQSFRYRRELAPLDEEAVALGRRAAARLVSAGRRAPARGDGPATKALLSRALSLLPEDDPDRLALLPDLSEALGMCGDYVGELALLDEAIARAEAVGDRRTRSYGLLLRGLSRTHFESGFMVDEAFDEAEEALRVFEELEDERLQAIAWQVLAEHHTFRGHFHEAIAADERGLIHATAAGDERLELDARVHIGICLFYGDAPTQAFVSYTEGMLEEAGAKLRARSLQALHGRALAMLGRFDDARKVTGERVTAQQSFGNTFIAAVARGDLGLIELLAGDPAAAEEHLRRSCEALAETGEQGYLSTTAAQLADTLYLQGLSEEAKECTRISEEASAPDDQVSQILWRSVRGKTIASEGHLRNGEQLAREAVALAEDVDTIDLRGDALMALAEVLRLAERSDEALPVIEEALRLYEQKGNVVSAGRARALLDELRKRSEP
jgi:class 3 adenylate cyclase/tetratricopeptide (TPR) repeat protein